MAHFGKVYHHCAFAAGTAQLQHITVEAGQKPVAFAADFPAG